MNELQGITNYVHQYPLRSLFVFMIMGGFFGAGIFLILRLLGYEVVRR